MSMQPAALLLPQSLRRLLHGVPCVQLDAGYRCKLFGRPERPAFCASLKPGAEMCGASRAEAMAFLTTLEALTRPRNAGTGQSTVD